MKVFIGTNIFLDLILKREHYKEALKIFNAISNHLFTGIILDVTILYIDYIAKKQIREIRDFLNLINDTFIIVGVTNKSISKALKLSNNDLEDNLQYICANENKCDVLITNDKNFYNGDIEVMSSFMFLEKFF